MSATKTSPITSAVMPDLEVVRRFIADLIARGAIVTLVASVVALVTRMRDLNTELIAKLASKTRARPPSETMRRLQLELPLLMQPAANDVRALPVLPEKKKRGPKNSDPHGRPMLPDHLPRIPDVHAVSRDERMCPDCASKPNRSPSRSPRSSTSRRHASSSRR